MADLTTDPNWNKLRLNVMNVLREPSIIPLFLKNQWFALQDVGFHAKGTELRGKSEQTANATMRLASLTPEIFRHLDTEVSEIPFIILSPYLNVHGSWELKIQGLAER